MIVVDIVHPFVGDPPYLGSHVGSVSVGHLTPIIQSLEWLKANTSKRVHTQKAAPFALERRTICWKKPRINQSINPTMRLITHNMLMCNKKGVANGFPLRIEAEEVEVVASDFHVEFVRKMLGKIDWAAFLAGAKALNVAEGIPEEIDTETADEEVLRKVHHALLEVHVKKGKLVCPESGREFNIIDGIPNMLLREDEV